MNEPITPGALHAKVVELLRNRPRTLEYEDIAEKIDVSVPWLKNLATGRIDDPSVNRIERLYTLLTGKQLNV